MPQQNHHEQDFFPDEQEIEISDLPADNRNSQAKNVRKISLAARYTPQQRKRQVIITSSIVLVALVVFLVSIFPVQAIFSQLLSSNTKRQLSGDDLFYFPELPSWGMFTLDGKPLKAAPTTDSGPPLQLARGKHTLTWRGEPFSQLQCTLIVPPIPDQQTCSTRASGANEYTKGAWTIDFQQNLSLEQLPPTERTALTVSLQDTLNKLTASDIVQPGEQYSYQQNGRVYTAHQLLRATQRFLLDTDVSAPPDCKAPRSGVGCSWGMGDCRLICTLNWPTRAGDPSTRGWHVAAVVRQTWNYAPLSGHKQAAQQNMNTQGDQYLVTFQITRDHNQWHAAFHPQGASPFDDPNCIGLVGQITSSDIYQELDETQQRITWTFSSASNRASGCLATGTLDGGTSLQVSASANKNVFLLYRFNRLQTVDDLAHQLWPTLPQADRHTQEVAMQIANHAAFVS